MSSLLETSQNINAYPGHGYGAALAVVMGGLVVGSELIAPHLQRGSKETTILGDNGKTYAFAGLKWANARFLAPYIEPAMGEVDYIQYSSRDGVCPASIATALAKRFEQPHAPESINLVVHSLGKLTALLALQKAIESGVQVPHIDTIFGLGSPRDNKDIKNNGRYRSLPKLTQLFGGSLVKYGGEIVTDVVPSRNKIECLKKSMRLSFHERRNMQSPLQWGTQLDLAYRATELDLSVHANAGVIDERTTVKLGYDRLDPVIWAEQSAERWSSELQETGARVVISMSESNKHVDPDALPSDFWQTDRKAYSTN